MSVVPVNVLDPKTPSESKAVYIKKSGNDTEDGNTNPTSVADWATTGGAIEKAEAKLAKSTSESDAIDDLLGGDDTIAPEKEYTAEEVRAKFLKVQEKIGREETRKLLAELGVKRLPDLKKEKFATTIKMLQGVLDNAEESVI